MYLVRKKKQNRVICCHVVRAVLIQYRSALKHIFTVATIRTAAAACITTCNSNISNISILRNRSETS